MAVPARELPCSREESRIPENRIAYQHFQDRSAAFQSGGEDRTTAQDGAVQDRRQRRLRPGGMRTRDRGAGGWGCARWPNLPQVWTRSSPGVGSGRLAGCPAWLTKAEGAQQFLAADAVMGGQCSSGCSTVSSRGSGIVQRDHLMMLLAAFLRRNAHVRAALAHYFVTQLAKRRHKRGAANITRELKPRAPRRTRSGAG